MNYLKNRKVDEGVDFSKSTSLTQQEFRDACDINSMIRRALMGDLSVLRKPHYGDVRGISTNPHETANALADAQTAWHDLPDSVRATFGSVDAFVEYLNAPKEDKPSSDVVTVEKPVETVSAQLETPAPSNT